MAKSKEEELEERLVRLEENIQKALSPFEPTIMKIQSLLVWEKPMKSALMIVCVHGIFWFFTYSGCQFYSTMCTLIMVAYLLHTWKKKIWPEIRVPPTSPDIDEWTPVHPKLLSVPELCKHLACFWCYLTRIADWWVTLRRSRPFKFCIETSFIFTCGAVIGHYVSGILLSYVIIMSVILWPCLQYHNLLKKIYMKFEPIFMKLDYSIKVKNKWRYEGDKAEVRMSARHDDGKLTTSMCADNESDLEDFYPSDPLISAALAHVITDSEDEGGTPSVSLTPNVSKEPSVTYSDDDNDNNGAENDDDFALSVEAMPSFEDTLDHTDDELLDLQPDTRGSRESSEESMRFVSSHFQDSDEDEETLAQESSGKIRKSKSSAQGRRQRQADPSQNLAENLVAKAITSVMTSAIQSSVLGALQSMAGASNPSLVQQGGDRIASTYTDSESEDDLDSTDHAVAEPLKERKASEVSEDSASLNIEEDFEFLDEYELESSHEKD